MARWILGVALTVAAACGPPGTEGLRTVHLALRPIQPSEQPLGGRGALQLRAYRGTFGNPVDIHVGPPGEATTTDRSVDGAPVHVLAVAIPPDPGFQVLVQLQPAAPGMLGPPLVFLTWDATPGVAANQLPPGNADVDLGQVDLDWAAALQHAQDVHLVPPR